MRISKVASQKAQQRAFAPGHDWDDRVTVSLPTSCAPAGWAAHAAILSRCYGSIVCIVDPDKPSDVEYISALRRRSPRTWIIMVIPAAGIDTHRFRSYCGADAFLTTPFSKSWASFRTCTWTA